jgi:hypothetical protein
VVVQVRDLHGQFRAVQPPLLAKQQSDAFHQGHFQGAHGLTRLNEIPQQALGLPRVIAQFQGSAL